MKKKNKPKESLDLDELLKMMKGDEIMSKAPEQTGPTTILDALEEEMKNAKIIEKSEETESKAVTEVKKPEDKNVEEKKEVLILEVPEDGKDAQYEVEPAYKTDDSNPKFFKAAVIIIVCPFLADSKS